MPTVTQVEPLQYWMVPPARLRPEFVQVDEVFRDVSMEMRFTVLLLDQSYSM